MTFGFQLPSSDDDDERRDSDPANAFAALFGGGSGGPPDLGAALQQLGRLLSYEGGPVNWDLAKDSARQGAAASGDRSVSDAERRAVEEAVRLAEVWLDGACRLPAGTTSAAAWSRAEWVEGTLPAWQRLVEPVAESVVEASTAVLPGDRLGERTADESTLDPSNPMSQLLGPMAEPMMGQMMGQMMGMARQLTGAMFGAQVGQGVGQLAAEVLTGTDVGLPLTPAGVAVLLPQNVEAFGAGLGIPQDEVRLFLAVREAAHHRLFAHVPWLEGRLHAAVAEYAAGITVDPGRLEGLLGGIDPQDLTQVQNALESGLFTPEESPAQQAALARLETLLALVEGWVDVVTAAAASPLPSVDALRETMRRRRASGGPAEQTFATLVGLELRPRRLREAATLWGTLTSERGVDARDALWDHPDLLPASADLDDPASFTTGPTDDVPSDLSGLDDLPPASTQE